RLAAGRSARVLGPTRARPTSARPRRAARRGAKPNIFFFGHFANMSEDDYMAEMERIITSDALAYEAAVRDIHSLGIYLYRKKYRFLRLAYVAILAGFILATAVEVWSVT